MPPLVVAETQLEIAAGVLAEAIVDVLEGK
jgi:hypothetical protein